MSNTSNAPRNLEMALYDELSRLGDSIVRIICTNDGKNNAALELLQNRFNAVQALLNLGVSSGDWN